MTTTPMTNHAAIQEKASVSMSLPPERIEKMFIAAVNRLHRGKLTIDFPSGNACTLSGSQDYSDGAQFHGVVNLNSYRTVKRTLVSKSVGFAEGYINDEWDSPDLTHLLELMACNMDAMEAAIQSWGAVRTWNRIQHFFRSNSKRGSRKNIAYHYDLGNDFYTRWLDPSMTYSSAVFDDEHDDLESAQLNKYRLLAERLALKPDHRVLEIGCGWGGFAEFAASNYGCQIVCLTLSQEQLAFAQERIQDAKLDDLVELRLQDYRDVEGQFDRIVSIEMFEAVGEEYWATYFDQMRDSLKPGGKAGLQIISIENDRFEGYRNETDFIQKYIFPGGMLPSPEKLDSHIEQAGLRKIGEHTFGLSYARTLAIWRKEFLRHWDEIAPLGYSRKFKRMWEYYLCYCEAGFRRGTIDVGHYFLQKDGAAIETNSDTGND
jgi:cyclopropane-fatty-acyl-phospholipid synthase